LGGSFAIWEDRLAATKDVGIEGGLEEVQYDYGISVMSIIRGSYIIFPEKTVY
jgi:hypothetical protein